MGSAWLENTIKVLFSSDIEHKPMTIGPRIMFFFTKNILGRFFYSFSNLGPGMVQLKYQRLLKRLTFSFLVL